MRDVAVLGAGLVSRAHVRYLLDHGFSVTVADQVVSKAEAIIDSHPDGAATAFDIVEEPAKLSEIVAGHRLVVSLLPWQFHARVARACLDGGRHMVTASYVNDEMRALDAEARAKGLTLLNEVGVDPGIDHMTAMQVIHRVQAEGGEITSFQSYCGGLPAPEANDNPFGYKFSWSPRGVLLAGLNAAHFRRNGHLIDIAGEELFDNVWPAHATLEGAETALEGYANRDSMPYTGYYGIDPRDTMFRGTLRYPGWCATMKQVARLGYLGIDEITDFTGGTFAELTAYLIGVETSDNLQARVAQTLSVDAQGPELSCMAWLGLFEEVPLPGPTTPVDILTARMLEKMSYGENERDMLVLQHTFVAELPDHVERITSTMIDFGIPGGDSSMSRTVGLPAAVGVRFLLEGSYSKRGVVVPVEPDFYEPALAELKRLGITFEESVERIV
ncbi:MAG: saccharopine dehydrogenase [bacterium]|nr:saccharopine dehydrogenase [bacterium]